MSALTGVIAWRDVIWRLPASPARRCACRRSASARAAARPTRRVLDGEAPPSLPVVAGSDPLSAAEILEGDCGSCVLGASRDCLGDGNRLALAQRDRSAGIGEPADELRLRVELGGDQRGHDREISAGRVGEYLGASAPGVESALVCADRDERAVAVDLDECGADVSKPAGSFERDEAGVADHDQSLESCLSPG